MMAERTTLAIAILTGITIFLLVLSVGRSLAVRRALLGRMERFLGAAPGVPSERTGTLGPEPPAPRGTRLAGVLTAHRNDILWLLAAVGLLIVGRVLYGWLLGVTLALVVLVVALWRAQHRGIRVDQLEAQLVPALRMMASATESGLSVRQALERLTNESPNPIADEFGQVVHAIDLGTPIHTALGDMGRHVRSPAVEGFAMIVSVQHRIGGNLPSLLLTFATSLQERLQLKAEVGALTAQARYSGWVLAGLPFFVMGMLLLASPSYIVPLFTTMLGRIMLGFAAVLLVAGLLAIRTISRVEL
jgi:tight adherence protein B